MWLPAEMKAGKPAQRSVPYRWLAPSGREGWNRCPSRRQKTEDRLTDAA